jgi:stress-induced morphogen
MLGMSSSAKTSTDLASSSSPSRFPVTDAIRHKLTEAFRPTHLEVINESHMHSVPKDSETHFKVVVVSTTFEEVRAPLQRHRLINGTLAAELEGPVHALSIIAKSPSQWANNPSVPASPNCRGGDGSLPPKNDPATTT